MDATQQQRDEVQEQVVAEHVVAEQPALRPSMEVSKDAPALGLRGGGEGEDVCCGLCAGFMCFECCKDCC